MLDQPTLTGANGGAQFFDALGDVQSDSLLALIAMANADPRPDKIDVGVGVYRDGAGNTPILRAVKAAEKLLWETQKSKSYIGGFGDKRYTELLRPIVLGRHANDDRIAGLHTPGGCGALSLGFKLIATAHPGAKVLVGTPTWPNHIPVVQAAGLNISEYRYYDRLENAHSLRRDDGCLEWRPKGRRGAAPRLLPQSDRRRPQRCAMGRGGRDRFPARPDSVRRSLPTRAWAAGSPRMLSGLHLLLDVCDEVIVSQSCDKNFGVYRDRVGSLFLKTARADQSKRAMDHVVQIAREMWSMPPDHGAAAVRIVLEDAELRADWNAEVGEMRDRINSIRSADRREPTRGWPISAGSSACSRCFR